MTGTFALKKDYLMGNPTYFALPPAFKDFYHLEDNLFHSIPNTTILIDKDH